MPGIANSIQKFNHRYETIILLLLGRNMIDQTRTTIIRLLLLQLLFFDTSMIRHLYLGSEYNDFTRNNGILWITSC